MPIPVAGAAAGLSVLAAGLAGHADIGSILGDGNSAAGELRIIVVGGVASNVVNNLPAFLVGLPFVAGERAVATLLLAVNVAPTILVTGSLSGLLWLDTIRRAGLDVSAWTYTRIGVAAGLPATIAAAATFVLLR